jgi:hypothetical protein
MIQRGELRAIRVGRQIGCGRSKWRSYGNLFATADRDLLFWR